MRLDRTTSLLWVQFVPEFTKLATWVELATIIAKATLPGAGVSVVRSMPGESDIVIHLSSVGEAYWPTDLTMLNAMLNDTASLPLVKFFK